MVQTIKDFNLRLADLKGEYETWRTHYQDISDYLLPRKGRFLDERPNDGGKCHQAIVDNTGGRALRSLAAGMQSGLTSPARPWFKLSLRDKEMLAHAPVRRWLDEVTKRMHQLFHRSNFYTATHNIYREMGAFGTGCMVIDRDPTTTIRCYSFTVGQYYLACGADRRVNSLYRVYSETARNIQARFGAENCSRSVNNMVENGNGEKYVKLIHLIEPAEEGVLPVLSATYEQTNHEGKFLARSGYDSMPLMAPRWDVTGDDVYGTSPGMETLGDVKSLQEFQKQSLSALQKMVNPPMNAPLEMKKSGGRIIPGGINYLDVASGKQGFAPTYQVNPDFRSLEYKIEKAQQAIREGFFADLFLLISQTNKDMTATEVLERNEEKLLMLGPVIERIQPELLDLVIDRVFYIMESDGLLPDPPEILNGEDLQVEYISMLAQAQKRMGISSIEQTATFVAGLAQLKPEALDKLDQDEAIDQFAEMAGAPAKIIVPDDQVDQIRKQRIDQQNQREAVEQGKKLAEGAKTMSETKTGENNALTSLLNNIGSQEQPPI